MKDNLGLFTARTVGSFAFLSGFALPLGQIIAGTVVDDAVFECFAFPAGCEFPLTREDVDPARAAWVTTFVVCLIVVLIVTLLINYLWTARPAASTNESTNPFIIMWPMVLGAATFGTIMAIVSVASVTGLAP